MNAVPTKTMAIVTPSYAPDVDRFRRLHESVLRFTDASVRHYVIVPSTDVHLYRKLGSDRLVIRTHQDVLPEGIVATDRLAQWSRQLPLLPRSVNCSALSLRPPYRPIRGWVLQQILKLSVPEQLSEDVLVYIDSDVVLVRPVGVEDFVRDGVVRLYTAEGRITRSMERHYQWCRTAHELLGIPWQGDDSYPDHVAGVISWDRELVRQCVQRVEEVAGTPWAVAIARNRHFSEWILYGTFVRNFGTPRAQSFQRDTTLCRSYWTPTPMGPAEAERFIESFGEDDLAVHIQSKSGTDENIVRSIVGRLEGSGLS